MAQNDQKNVNERTERKVEVLFVCVGMKMERIVDHIFTSSQVPATNCLHQVERDLLLATHLLFSQLSIKLR